MFEECCIEPNVQEDQQAVDRRHFPCSCRSLLGNLILIPLIYTEALPKRDMG